MTKFSSDSTHAREHPGGPVTELVPPVQRDGNVCDLYAPGHQMHYKHQGNAVRSPAVTVAEVLRDGTEVILGLDDGRELRWQHHDPHRLGRILELLRGKCVIYPEWHALRIGPYWFNCAGEDDEWQECRVSAASRTA